MNTLKNDTSRIPDYSKTADFYTSFSTCKPIDYGLLKPHGLYLTNSVWKMQSAGPSVIEPLVNQMTHHILSLHSHRVTFLVGSSNNHLSLLDPFFTGVSLKRCGRKLIHTGLFSILAVHQKQAFAKAYLYNIIVLYLFGNIYFQPGPYSILAIYNPPVLLVTSTVLSSHSHNLTSYLNSKKPIRTILQKNL